MLGVNISKSIDGNLDDRDPADLRALAAKWWAMSDETVRGYADTLIAIAHNVIAGVYRVTEAERDPDADNKVVFTLADAPEWQFLVGEAAPEAVTWTKGQANPVRKVPAATAAELAARRPARIEAGHGWSLEVDPDGAAATVRAPYPALLLDGLQGSTARVSGRKVGVSRTS